MSAKNSKQYTHTDDEKGLVGIWTILQINKKLAKSWKIMKINQVWHVEKKSNNLFKEYIDFMKIKKPSLMPMWLSSYMLWQSKSKWIMIYTLKSSTESRQKTCDEDLSESRIFRVPRCRQKGSMRSYSWLMIRIYFTVTQTRKEVCLLRYGQSS